MTDNHTPLEGDGLILRLADIDDAELLFHWRNDTLTRAASRQKEPIPFEEHISWLKATLTNPKRQLYLAFEGKEAVGTCRADRDDNGIYELSWTVAPSARGRRIGKRMMSLLASHIDGPLFAEVRQDNPASIAIAKHIGMELTDDLGEVYHFKKPK